jgi:hypothetical protein
VHATTDGHLLSYLVGDVFEVGLNEVGLNSVYDLKASTRKSKANSACKISKFSPKVRSKKSTMVTQ